MPARMLLLLAAALAAPAHAAGTAVPPEDPAAFCGALEEMLDDPARRGAMGRSGREFVQGWASPAAVAESYERLFEELRARRALSSSRAA